MGAPAAASGVKTSSARPGAGDGEVHGLVEVAVGVAADHDGLLPGAHGRLDVLHHDRLAEYRAVEDAAQGAVGRGPGLFEAVLAHAVRVGRDGRALDSHAEPRYRLARPRR